MLLSNFTQKTPVPSGTGNVRNSLILRSGSEWNRKVPNATLSGVECHSSSGAKHRRRSTPELNAESRLHRPPGSTGTVALAAFFAGCSIAAECTMLEGNALAMQTFLLTETSIGIAEQFPGI
jgi:hypothetical protein